MDCQPKAGTSLVAESPAAMEPKMKPVNISATINERRRCGEYSEVSAIVFGSAPPIARPVRNRNPSSTAIDELAAVSSAQRPRSGKQMSSNGRLPILSASGAMKTAPSNRPNRPREKNSPRSEGLS